MTGIPPRSRRSFFSGAPTEEGHRPTMLELFFDLVYAFAFTAVGLLIEHTPGPIGALQAFAVLGLLWWTWTNASWLANQTRADGGFTRTAMIASMAAVLVIAISIPQAFSEGESPRPQALAIAVGFFLVRLILAISYWLAARGDPLQQRQVIYSITSATLPSSALLVIGAFLTPLGQTIIWAAAFVLDSAIIFVTSRQGHWRVRSATHFSDRHGLIVILALGESIVAIGRSASQADFSPELVAGMLLAFAIAVTMWKLYFGGPFAAGEARLAATRDLERARIAEEAYTYSHLPIIAGVILCAVGVEVSLAHLQESVLNFERAAFLTVGVALFLVGTSLFSRRVHDGWRSVRFIAAAVVLASMPLLAALPTVWALAVLCGMLLAAIQIERGIRSRRARELGSIHASDDAADPEA